jgi:hypothetical protein
MDVTSSPRVLCGYKERLPCIAIASRDGRHMQKVRQEKKWDDDAWLDEIGEDIGGWDE